MGEKSTDTLNRQRNISLLNALSVRRLEQIAAEVVRDAIALHEKAEAMRDEWNQKYNPIEPILASITERADLFMQYQQIRFPDDLIEPADDRYYPENRNPPKRGSAIKEVSIEQMLEALPTIEQIQELAHSENVEEWIRAVQAKLTHRMSLAALAEKTGLAIVPLWIALLFGGFEIKREGDFYEGVIFVDKLSS